MGCLKSNGENGVFGGDFRLAFFHCGNYAFVDILASASSSCEEE
jgi:hypothetical protein